MEIISALETNLKPVRDDISVMKDQINEINISAVKMFAKQDGLKSEIAVLKKSNKNAEFAKIQ